MRMAQMIVRLTTNLSVGGLSFCLLEPAAYSVVKRREAPTLGNVRLKES